MVIALLAVLGVDLGVIVVLIGLVLARRRWVMRQPDAFAGAIRVSTGSVKGFGPKWKRGYGRWVRDVLVWTKPPLLARNELVAVDAVHDQRPARAGEVSRLGDRPIVAAFAVGEATVQVATRAGSEQVLVGPYAAPAAKTPSAG